MEPNKLLMQTNHTKLLTGKDIVHIGSSMNRIFDPIPLGKRIRNIHLQ
uniref:Uncharacterized protein n=1 Tax=Lepeophtheirus salmonis TaxID=72036 RepID=A0A0K2TX65_LEPSM